MTTLARRLTLVDAVVIGLGSMWGAGVFVVFAPAAAASGGLLIALAIAAVVAFCNATASAQLAAQYPSSGGTYVYGRERLGAWPGFLAGWGFVIGKTASAAAMALTAAAYLVPDPWQRPFAAALVLLLAAVNYRGITRTAFLARVIVTLVIIVLAAAVAANVAGANAAHWAAVDVLDASPYAVLQAAGLLFFAFAGYARIATLGEEVVDPTRTIPRAIVIALGLTVVGYAAVAVSLVGVLGLEGLAASPAPLVAAAEAGPAAWLVPVIRVGGGIAATGALLALVAGIGRTALAMARERDLPGWLDAVHPRFRTPHRAEVVLALVVTVIVGFADLRGAIGFSSFGVLFYYFVANAAAFTQDAAHRRYPRALQVAGGLACLVLLGTLPWQSVVAGLAVFAVGAGYRWTRTLTSR